MSAASKIALAKRLLKKFGQPIIFTQIETGSTVDENGDPVITEITHSGQGYPGRYEASDIDGTVIMADDTRLVCYLDIRPEKGWRCFVDNRTFRVMDVVIVTEKGIDVLYICPLRV